MTDVTIGLYLNRISAVDENKEVNKQWKFIAECDYYGIHLCTLDWVNFCFVLIGHQESILRPNPSNCAQKNMALKPHKYRHMTLKNYKILCIFCNQFF